MSHFYGSPPLPPHPIKNSPVTCLSRQTDPRFCSHRAWRETRDANLAHRAELASTKKADTIKQAQQYVDDFYENYNTKKEKSIAKTRKEAEEFLAKREDTSAGGTSWERIAKLVDLSGKGAKGGASGTGKERFREMLAGLRKDEKAPGASGY